jgi:hypothetical protein
VVSDMLSRGIAGDADWGISLNYGDDCMVSDRILINYISHDHPRNARVHALDQFNWHRIPEQYISAFRGIQ